MGLGNFKTVDRLIWDNEIALTKELEHVLLKSRGCSARGK